MFSVKKSVIFLGALIFSFPMYTKEIVQKVTDTRFSIVYMKADPTDFNKGHTFASYNKIDDVYDAFQIVRQQLPDGSFQHISSQYSGMEANDIFDQLEEEWKLEKEFALLERRKLMQEQFEFQEKKRWE